MRRGRNAALCPHAPLRAIISKRGIRTRISTILNGLGKIDQLSAPDGLQNFVQFSQGKERTFDFSKFLLHGTTKPFPIYPLGSGFLVVIATGGKDFTMAFRPIIKAAFMVLLVAQRVVIGQGPESIDTGGIQVLVPQDAVPVARFSEPEPGSLTLATLFEIPSQDAVPEDKELKVLPLVTAMEAQIPASMNLNPIGASTGSFDLVRQPIQVANSLSRVGTTDFFRSPATSPLPIRGISFESGSSADWNPLNYCWASPVVCHRPLYFEQVNLERYGIGCGPVVTPIASAAHFYGSIAMLPAKVICQPCHSCTCSLGHQRPGDCAPVQRRNGSTIAPSTKAIASDGTKLESPQQLPLPLEAEAAERKSELSANKMAAAPPQLQTPIRLPYPKRLNSEQPTAKPVAAISPVPASNPAALPLPTKPPLQTPVRIPYTTGLQDTEDLPAVVPSSVQTKISDKSMR